MEFQSKGSNIAIFVILAAGLLTTTMGVFSVPSVFADKCKNNEDNNCNETEVSQKIWNDNECKLENLSNDHSNENFDDNLLSCVNSVTNLERAIIPDQFAPIS
jgi:hypothetical protein